MATHNDFGKEAENKAVKFLQKKGYTILRRNYQYLKAEIDIIAKDEDTQEIVIVEVKARKDIPLINPEEAVTKAKRTLLVKAANEFILSEDLDVETRFDIISLYKHLDNWKIEHFENAFLSFE
jgi:putative endonuclease